jgi:hypothetical protein
MKLLAYFESFLTTTVNLNQGRLDQLHSRVTSIVNWLEADQVIGPLCLGHIPQGSWAHRTIIRPVQPNDEFDADLLLLLEEVKEWSASPREYIWSLRAAFKRSPIYADMVRKKNRCVRIGYSNDCHIDVVPHVVLDTGRQVIVNSGDNTFEDTNPQGFTDWMKEKDDLANGNLRKIIRLMKYVRDSKQTFSAPSVILTTLLGERVQAWDERNRYADVPTTLLNLMLDLKAWLSLYSTMPLIEDPSCPGTNFNHRWDQDRYAGFRKWIGYYADRIEVAYKEEDKAKSLAAWQQVFGSGFQQPVAKAAAAVPPVEPATKALAIRAPQEEFIEEMGFPFIGGHKARIECTVDRKAGFRHGPLRSLRFVDKQRTLRFRVITDAAEPFHLYWKVRNRGREAAQLGELRGEVFEDDGTRRHTERTLYTGRHYVEVYIVKDGLVIATDHHEVPIR